MKQKLTEDDRRALVAYRLERAHETIKEIPYHIYPKAEAFIQAIEELINNSGK